MAVQQRIAFEWTQSRVGSSETVLIDSPLPEQPGVWIGRTKAEAPDIDGLVYVTEQPDQKLAAGEMITCEFVAADGHDLIAVPL